MLNFSFFISIFFFSHFSLADEGVSLQKSIERGKEKSQICSVCHGVSGNSIIPIYPKIAGQFSSYLNRQLISFKLNGKDGRSNNIMYNIVKDLNEVDFVDLSNYYTTQLIRYNKPMTIEDQSSYEKGRILYLFGDRDNKIPACSSCHGVSGGGSELAGFPKLRAQHSEYIYQQLELYKLHKRTNDYNKIMQDVASKLSIEEMKCVAEFIAVM